MSNDEYEAVSALADGELAAAPATRAIDAVGRDPALAERWSRYHLIGEAMRGGAGLGPDDDLLSRVRADIDAEPVSLTPRRPVRRRSGPIAGFAIAASLAAVAVLGVRTLITDRADTADAPSVASAPAGTLAPTPQVNPTAVSTTVSTARSVAAPASRPSRLVFGAGGEARRSHVHWNELAPRAAARLNDYLVDHAEHRGAPMPGFHPYVRIVGYERGVPSR